MTICYQDSDVIVVGAGPVGLMLAGELRLGAVRVTVLEKLAEPTGQSRASQLNARTMEIFDQRDLVSRLGNPGREDRGHFGGLALTLDGLDSVYAGNWKIAQSDTEAVLQRWAAELGADILRSHELVGLEVDADRVVALAQCNSGLLRVSASYLVGCDGENSTVRRLAGFPVDGHAARLELLRADLSGLNVHDRRFERLERGLAIAATRGGITRVMMHEFGRAASGRTAAPGLREIAATWHRITGEDLSGGTLIWADTFNDASLLTTRYRQGRVLLAGDAAHRMMPAGGQALNVGLQDAANLGWKLAAEVRGWAPPGLLDSYHAERHPVAGQVIAGVEAQKLLLLGDQRVNPVRQLFTELLGLDSVRRHLGQAVSGLDIRYQFGKPGSESNRQEERKKERMGRLADKTALVTGSSRGIGRAIAERLARDGALVAVHFGSNQEAAEHTVKTITAAGGRAFPVHAELGIPGDVGMLFESLESSLRKQTGKAELNILVNNAGIMGGVKPEDLTPEIFDHLMAVNARAPLFIIQRALTLMPNGSRIINISSGLTRFANPDEIAYAMTKGAVEQLSLHYARYLASRQITINSVAPGITDNGSPVFDIPEAREQMAALSAFGRVGDPTDIADVVAFLASAEARWITGAFIDATGGTLLG